MLNVTLLCVGKLKEPYYKEAFAEYGKRLGAFCRLKVEEIPERRLPEDPSEAEVAAALAAEAAELERRVPKGAVLAAFCVEGEMLTSEGFCARLQSWGAEGKSAVCFLIGGSFGLDGALKRRADARFSLSGMTFPHHLFRVMAAEQLYRAFTIGAGMKYHK